MNYFALAGGIIAVIVAIYCLTRLVVVASGKKRFHSSWGFAINTLFVASFGSLAAWLLGLVAG